MRTTTCRSNVAVALAGACGVLLPALAGAQRAPRKPPEPASAAGLVVTLSTSTRAVTVDPWLWEALFPSRDGSLAPADSNAQEGTPAGVVAAASPGGAATRVAYGDVRVAHASSNDDAAAARTIFARESPAPWSRARDGASGEVSSTVSAATTAGRFTPTVADLLAAPYVPEAREVEGAGRLVGTAPDASEASALEDPGRLSHGRLVTLLAPRSHGAVRGARFLVYRDGPLLDGDRQVVLPTGVVEVVEPATQTRAAVARVSAALGDVRVGQGVLPLGTVLSSSAPPVLATDEALVRVLWTAEDAGAPDVVVLDLAASSGFRAGDAVSLVERGDGGEREVAYGVLLRVNTSAASALIAARAQPRGSGALLARVVKLP